MPSLSEGAALAYHEPSIVVILIQSSFLLVLNILNWALDALLYCGLVGQILVGVAWGTPGGQILSVEAQHVVVQLGYLGLILLVFEGGLSTSFPSLKANLVLSVGVAVTGISVPIGLSFLLSPMVGASNLQCFAAGAALCSTSLGTTFAVIRASGLTSTRLGVVLTSAAMLDDVVGLVMVQVISSLGVSGASVSAVTVVRPVLVSVAFTVVAGAACPLVIRPIAAAVNGWRAAHRESGLAGLLRRKETSFVLVTALLVTLVTASSYAGTSNLFAAYIAGSVASWFDSEVPCCPEAPGPSGTAADHAHLSEDAAVPSPLGLDIFERYYQPAVKWILQPFFFASIGFSIPITRMFSGPIFWKGVVYAVLMLIAKLSCGLWLVRFPGLRLWLRRLVKDRVLETVRASRETPTAAAKEAQTTSTPACAEGGVSELADPPTGPTQKAVDSTPQDRPSGVQSRDSPPKPPKPLSLYPAAVLGVAMVPRGEIGFLISSVAQSNGVFGAAQDSGDSEIFLIATWAIVLCTVLGPLCVGLLVRRVRKLETEAASSAGQASETSRRDVLGVWGVQRSESSIRQP